MKQRKMMSFGAEMESMDQFLDTGSLLPLAEVEVPEGMRGEWKIGEVNIGRQAGTWERDPFDTLG